MENCLLFHEPQFATFGIFENLRISLFLQIWDKTNKTFGQDDFGKHGQFEIGNSVLRRALGSLYLLLLSSLADSSGKICFASLNNFRELVRKMQLRKS